LIFSFRSSLADCVNNAASCEDERQQQEQEQPTIDVDAGSKVTAIRQTNRLATVAPLQIFHIARQIGKAPFSFSTHRNPNGTSNFPTLQLSIFAEGERISGGSLANICIFDIYVPTTLYIM